jgi:tellurite resistance protein TehA-like permease
VFGPSFFTSVMATGIVALALREWGAAGAAWVLAGVAAAGYVALVAVQVVRRPRPASRGEALDLFAFVAASEVLSSLSHWYGLTVALWAVGLAAWLVIVPRVLAAPAREGEAVRGSWLLAVVATDSLAVAGASITTRSHNGPLLEIELAWWLLALALYCVLATLIARRARRRDIGIAELHGDHWVAMGALAISALAGCRMVATIGTLGWASALHEAARWLAIAAWIGALLWLPALLAAESWRLRHPPLYTPGRWSTVFPLGMLAVASHALATGAGVSSATIVFHVFAVLAVAAWLATATGFALSVARST